MNKFFKGVIKNLALIALAIGMIGGFVACDELKEQRNANKEVIKLEIEKAGSPGLAGKYVEIEGGFANILETYEWGIGSQADGEEMIVSEYYYPIVQTLDGAPLFIVASEEPPALGGDTPAIRKGLLKPYDDIPKKVAEALAVQYPNTSFVLLDTLYAPAPIMGKYINFFGFWLLVIASFFAFRYSIRETPKPEDGTE
jgi:hypothetical protein